MYTFMSINGSSGSCHPRRDAELIPICNRLLTDLHVVRKMKWILVMDSSLLSDYTGHVFITFLIITKIDLCEKIRKVKYIFVKFLMCFFYYHFSS